MHPLVIVKSDKSPTAFYDQALSEFSDKRFCEGAVHALQELEESPAHVVVIEADVGEMSGAELAEAIRDIDAGTTHFTYCILVGASAQDLPGNFSHNVDALVASGDSIMLRACVQAGMRISAQMNILSEHNESLRAEREDLMKGQLLDAVTGLGNRRFAEQSLSDCVRQIESRGGVVCFLLIAVGNYEQVRKQYDETIQGELMYAVARRIQHLVRPMDIVTYFAPGEFALVLLQQSLEQCTADCYQRIFDGVRLKSYKTSVGYIDAHIGMSICASGGETGAPQVDTMIDTAEANLATALERRTIEVTHLNVG